MSTALSRLFNIDGMTGVITGAGGTLCGIMAEHLAGLGANVALLDLDQDASRRRAHVIEASGGCARPYRCDVLDRAECVQVAARVSADLGPVDFLINGAGGNHPSASTDSPFAESDPDGTGAPPEFCSLAESAYRRVFDLNYFGTLVPSQVFGEGMARRERGSIINISSLNAITPLTKIPAYATAKSAVASLTKWMAVHFSRVGVRVNALAPGFFMTEQLRYLHTDPKTGEPTERSRHILSQTPFQRYGRPEELVGAVVWLISDASSFVSGALVPIDGGFSSYSI